MNYNKLLSEIKDKGQSVSEISKQIGMSKGGLYHAINNKTLTISKLEAICEYLNIPIAVFFDDFSTSNEKAEITKLSNEIEKKSKRITELEEHLETYKLLIDLLKKTNAISGADLYYKSLPEKDRPKFGDEPNWEEVGKNPFPIDDPDEKIKFAEKLAKEKKKEK
jgi:transcriptional regulator with XRE-family HTH domain